VERAVDRTMTTILYCTASIVISVSSSSAYHSPLLDIGLSNLSPSRSIFGYSHPPPASRPAQIVTPRYVYLDAVSTPELVYPSGYRFYGWYDQPTATSSIDKSVSLVSFVNLSLIVLYWKWKGQRHVSYFIFISQSHSCISFWQGLIWLLWEL
jgi:hypothetical protein